MLPGLETMACAELAVPVEVMRHVVRVESAFNPYAIGVVGGRLVRQPRNRSEAVSTARMLEAKGYNFSLGIAQVNRYNLASYGLDSYERAFEVCPNLQAGARILAECHERAGGDWGKAFSCYYSGNFTTGFRHGYVQKVFDAWRTASRTADGAPPVPLAGAAHGVPPRVTPSRATALRGSLLQRRIRDAAVVAHEPAPDPVSQLAAAPPAPAASAPPRAPAPGPAAVATPGPVRVQPGGVPPLLPDAVQAGLPDQPTHAPPPTAHADPPPSANRATPPARDEAFVF